MSISGIKQEAVDFLIKEVFSDVHAQIREAHANLVKENNLLRGTTAHFFQWEGIVYPKGLINGKPINVKTVGAIPILHCSLLKKFFAAENMLEDAGFTSIKNYIREVISQSFNGMVIKELLPTFLINALQGHLGPVKFLCVDQGVTTRFQVTQSIEETEQAIENIREHYGETMKELRFLLMNRLLLQG